MSATRAAVLSSLRAAVAQHAREDLPEFREDVVRVDTAVLVPLRYDGEVHVLLTVRAGGMRHHANEVCFPGGKPEPDDAHLAATALREAEEEVGLARGDVELLGELSSIPTATSHFRLNPFVGVVSAEAPAYTLSAEVARVVDIPVRALLDGTVAYRAMPFSWSGRAVIAPIFELRDGTIVYGATAYILVELLQVIAKALGLTMPEPEMMRGDG